MGFLGNLFTRAEPALSEATPRDSAAIAALHARSFHRGWGEDEVTALLLQPNVITHRAMAGRAMAGFIMSRLAADEAEILSVASSPAWRGRGIGRALLALHMRRLAGLGARAIFLEVGENNTAALALYARTGFTEVSRRENYYAEREGPPSAALILRRGLI
jgi:ribosomal-protein-alanine N-acetyltransferase